MNISQKSDIMFWGTAALIVTHVLAFFLGYWAR
jgi:hypothetical protein